MYKFRKIFTLISICVFLLFPQKANAGVATDIADKTIEFASKTAYYLTKYTLKSGWFLTRKTTKGIAILSKSVYRASKDAFSPGISKKKPIPKNPQYREYDTELPPPPPLLD